MATKKIIVNTEVANMLERKATGIFPSSLRKDLRDGTTELVIDARTYRRLISYLDGRLFTTIEDVLRHILGMPPVDSRTIN